MFWITLVKVFCDTAAIYSDIGAFRLLTKRDLRLYIFHFAVPHAKKSQTDRAGERAGQWRSPKRDEVLFCSEEGYSPGVTKGLAIKSVTAAAPELWPTSVTRPGSPQNWSMWRLVQRRAVSWSCNPMLPGASSVANDKNPATHTSISTLSSALNVLLLELLYCQFQIC